MANFKNNTVSIESPPGSIMAYLGGGNTVGAGDPDGWLICDGRAISRSTYSRLFELLSTSYGTGDGSSTFNLPDLRGQFLRGAKRSATTTPGSFAGNVGTTQPDVIKTTTATTDAQLDSIIISAINGLPSGANADINVAVFGANNQLKKYTNFDHRHSVTIGSGNETRPNNMSVNWIIKY